MSVTTDGKSYAGLSVTPEEETADVLAASSIVIILAASTGHAVQ